MVAPSYGGPEPMCPTTLPLRSKATTKIKRQTNGNWTRNNANTGQMPCTYATTLMKDGTLPRQWWSAEGSRLAVQVNRPSLELEAVVAAQHCGVGLSAATATCKLHQHRSITTWSVNLREPQLGDHTLHCHWPDQCLHITHDNHVLSSYTPPSWMLSQSDFIRAPQSFQRQMYIIIIIIIIKNEGI